MPLAFARPRPALLLLVPTLVGALFASTPAPVNATASTAPATAPASVGKAAGARGSDGRSTFRVATLNLKNTLGADAVADDIRQVIEQGDPSVIGFQERGGTAKTMRAALPRGWVLRMPTERPGTDLNPIAFDARVWKDGRASAELLTGHTWRRSTGVIAVDQYAVSTRLVHRESGHVIRAVSFHMPSEIHDKRTGGPNFRQRDRVEAFWRMADGVKRLADQARGSTQFVAMCDCNVSETRDTTSDLVRGRITRPLDLKTNYSAEEAGTRRSIDYVMAERDQDFRIVGWQQIEAGLATDHPAVITTLRESKGSLRARSGG